VPLTISPQQMLRDQGLVRQVHSTQNLGRRVFNEQRDFRRANPAINRSTRRAADRSKTDCRDRTAPARRANRPVSHNRSAEPS